MQFKHKPLFSIYVEGKAVPFDVQPYTEQGRLMVPSEALEADKGPRSRSYR